MMNRARREAILEECTRLLGEHGFDAMTLEQVAEAAGMAKAMLYKHFKGKEDLCCAAMASALERVHDFMRGLAPPLEPAACLQAVVRWILQAQLGGAPCLLPERRSQLRDALGASEPYQAALGRVRGLLLQWAAQAQRNGQIHPSWTPAMVAHVVLSGVDNPVTDALRQSGQHSAQDVVDCSARICMHMLHAASLHAPGPGEPGRCAGTCGAAG